ncbi:MAG TPA: HAD family hydrolase [Dehalococcoidia bacterium]|nr:HAD family hydrolase [Dehalococcoidia bacterium]
MRAKLREQGSPKRAVFIDKDGTLVVDVPYNVDPALIELTPGAASAMRTLAGAGYELFVVTNQSGVAKGLFPEAALGAVQDRIAALLADAGVALSGFYYCPHDPARAPCLCRKPQPGLIRHAAREHGVDLQRSWMIGDILADVEAGNRAGCRSALVDGGNVTWAELTEANVPTIVARNLEDAARQILRIDVHRSQQPAPAVLGRPRGGAP